MKRNQGSAASTRNGRKTTYGEVSTHLVGKATMNMLSGSSEPPEARATAMTKATVGEFVPIAAEPDIAHANAQIQGKK